MRDPAINPEHCWRAEPERATPALVCVLVTSARSGDLEGLEPAEIVSALCYRLTDRVEWLDQPSGSSAYGALLDLGRCPEDEARAICARLLARLARRGLHAQASVGPTRTLARLAAMLTATGTVRALSQEWLAAAAHSLPVALLAQLEPASVTPEIIARLRRYGLRTLGSLTRLEARDPQALRRQFGPAGAALATLARGADPRPFRPAPKPERISARLRFPASATPDQALAALPSLVARLAERLDTLGKQGRDLRLRASWESGAVTRARRRLARPLHQPDELAQAARALLASLLPPAGPPGRDARARSLSALTLALDDLVARLPARPTPLFALTTAPDRERERAARLERIAAEVGAPLARRYGAPALYRLETTQPDAILPEERVRLVHFHASPREPTPATRAAGVVSEAGETHGVIPPQPHWW